MSWSVSAVFRSFITDVMGDVTNQFDLSGTGVDAFKAATYTNSITPDKDATSANSCYNVDQWATAQEVYQSGQWAQGGVATTVMAISNPSTGVIMWDASNDTASGSAYTTPSATHGCLVYDDDLTSPADQAVCFNYFGAGSTVGGGVLTIVWHPNGLFRISV